MTARKNAENGWNEHPNQTGREMNPHPYEESCDGCELMDLCFFELFGRAQAGVPGQHESRYWFDERFEAVPTFLARSALLRQPGIKTSKDGRPGFFQGAGAM